MGVSEGDREGSWEGDPVGSSVGVAVGPSEGDAVGVWLGRVGVAVSTVQTLNLESYVYCLYMTCRLKGNL